jgi:23S rRNA (adenine2030-N6)-methyltransferase
MNYRHAYHAGNHTEVFKHSVLCLLLLELRKKPNPFTVLDTHSGAGHYDLLSPEAQRTGEAQDGIAIVIDKRIPSASSYLDIIRGLNPAGLHFYPGSPALAQTFLREDDRLVACELRDYDAALLRANFRTDDRVSIHHRDGYEAIRAFVPLPNRRGLVFIDPSFEQPDEFQRLADALNAGVKKWPTGIFMVWYPIKDRSAIRALRKRYRPNNPPTLCCEFLREAINGQTLAGSGLVICNPPWRFENKLTTLCRELVLAFDAHKARYSLSWWAEEHAQI